MSGTSIRIGLVVMGLTAALMVVGMMAAVIVKTEGPAWAAPKMTAGAKKCDSDMVSCDSRCKRVFETPDRIRACQARCVDANFKCYEKLPKISSSDTTGTAVPTSKAGQNIGKESGTKKDPMNVQPIIQSDSGNSTTPKTKNVGKAAGVKHDWSSTSTSGGTVLMKRSKDKKH